MDAPDKDPEMCRRLQVKVDYVFDRIEDTGPLAGDKFFKKINGVPDLREARIDVGNRAVRIFGDFANNKVVCLTVVYDGKKRDSLKQSEYQAIARKVKEHVDRVNRDGCEGGES